MCVVFGHPEDYALEAHFNFHVAMNNPTGTAPEDKLHRNAVATLIDHFLSLQPLSKEDAQSARERMLNDFFVFDNEQYLTEHVSSSPLCVRWFTSLSVGGVAIPLVRNRRMFSFLKALEL